MFGEAPAWPYQVEIKLDGNRFAMKLLAIEDWLQGWEIPYRVGSVLGDVTLLRVRFAEEKFARAFVFNHGGTLIPQDEVEAALEADLGDEDEYQRLAGDRLR